MSKLVVIIQCDTVTKRCSGYRCMDSFYGRKGAFADYGEDTQYMTMTCGGCCGVSVAAKLENIRHRLVSYKQHYDEIVVHLASCIVSDNYHRPPCPHKEYIQEIVERKGFRVVKGSYISKTATKKRELKEHKEF